MVAEKVTERKQTITLDQAIQKVEALTKRLAEAQKEVDDLKQAGLKTNEEIRNLLKPKKLV